MGNRDNVKSGKKRTWTTRVLYHPTTVSEDDKIKGILEDGLEKDGIYKPYTGKVSLYREPIEALSRAFDLSRSNIGVRPVVLVVDTLSIKGGIDEVEPCHVGNYECDSMHRESFFQFDIENVDNPNGENQQSLKKITLNYLSSGKEPVDFFPKEKK